MKLNFIYLFAFIFFDHIGFSQIIQISPAFPTVNDVITVQYDATQGNGGLVGVSPVSIARRCHDVYKLYFLQM